MLATATERTVVARAVAVREDPEQIARRRIEFAGRRAQVVSRSGAEALLAEWEELRGRVADPHDRSVVAGAIDSLSEVLEAIRGATDAAELERAVRLWDEYAGQLSAQVNAIAGTVRFAQARGFTPRSQAVSASPTGVVVRREEPDDYDEDEDYDEDYDDDEDEPEAESWAVKMARSWRVADTATGQPSGQLPLPARQPARQPAIPGQPRTPNVPPRPAHQAGGRSGVTYRPPGPVYTPPGLNTASRSLPPRVGVATIGPPAAPARSRLTWRGWRPR